MIKGIAFKALKMLVGTTSMGSSATPSVGGGQRAVLMEIPEKYYNEDQKASQAAITKVEREIARNKPGQEMKNEVKLWQILILHLDLNQSDIC